MTREEALAKLDEVRQAMHDQFEDDFGSHRTRLAALDAALTTATMHVEHLHDDEGREIELAKRVLARTTVHGSDEVRSPHNRSAEETVRHANALLGRA